MKFILLLGISGYLSIIVSSVNAGILGPSDPSECFEKYAPKVRLPDALNVVRNACVLGYDSENKDPPTNKVGRCIVKGSSEMYSFESTKKIINKCTKNIPWAFNFFNNQLMANINEQVERSARERRYNQARIEDELRESKNGVVSIYDVNSGTYKNCIKNGSQLTCF